MLQSISMTFHFDEPPGAVPIRSTANLALPVRVTVGDDTCHINSRDFDILRALEDHRILSLEQVWAGFFVPWRQESAGYLFLKDRCPTFGQLNPAYKRLAKLAKLGYVEHGFRREFPHIYRLAPEGQKLLRGFSRSRFKNLAPWPPDVRHPLMVSGIALFLSKKLGLEVIPERKLRAQLWSSIREDSGANAEPLADLAVVHGDSHMRIEVELSEKREVEYLSLWKRLDKRVRDENPYVLYCVSDRGLEQKILRWTSKDYFPGIYVAHIDDFCAKPDHPVWRNFDGSEFRFEDRAEGPVGRL